MVDRCKIVCYNVFVKLGTWVTVYPSPDKTIEIKTRGATMSRKAINREPTGERRIIQLHSDMTEAPSIPAAIFVPPQVRISAPHICSDQVLPY